MATVKNKIVLNKATQELYKNIYRYRITGMSHYELKEKFSVSQSTIDRALEWCKIIGLSELPPNDEYLNNLFNDINKRRTMLYAKLFKAKPTDMVAINRVIMEMDNQCLTLKGLLTKKIDLAIKKVTSKEEAYHATRDLSDETVKEMLDDE